MSENEPATDFSDVEARRSADSKRRLSTGRKIAFAIGLPLLRSIIWVLNATYRVEKVIGSDIGDRIVADKSTAYAPCYWHSQHLVLSNLMKQWVRRGFKAGFIVSASVDGDVPAQIAKAWGGEVIRGSAARTGALVLRDAQAMMKRGVSIITTPDGPRGPAFELKPGTVLMARLTGAPLVPLGFAASSAWKMNTWDHFVIPKPFAKIAIAIGEPIEVPRGASMQDLERIRDDMQAAMDGLNQASKDAVVDST